MNDASPSRKSIVIFDDDEDILMMCSSVLKQKGWEVNTFTDCRQVVERVETLQPSVIIMDNWLPDIGGINATRLLKSEEQLKNIPVIFFTANSDIKSLAAAAGAETYLSKPFDIDDLERSVSTALAMR